MGRGGGFGGRGRSSGWSGSVSYSNSGNSQVSQNAAAATGFRRLHNWFGGGSSNYDNKYVSPYAEGGPLHCELLQEIYDECLASFGEEYCSFSERKRKLVKHCGGVRVAVVAAAAAESGAKLNRESKSEYSSPWDEGRLHHWELL